MCGIVGYVGNRQASNLLVEGLSKLEYRGYDSAGVAILNNGINVRKFKGRLNNLATSLKENPINGHIGIGHTRWATHGEPSDVNSHPHTTENATISVVHNGIIENYMKLREWLTSKGYKFFSETDTEVIPNLVDYYYEGDLFEAVVKATSKLEGSFAIGVIAKNEPDKIVAVRKDSPLIVGLGKNESFIASDIPAVLNHTREVYLLEDKEFAILTSNGVELRNEDGEKIEKEIYHVTWNIDAAEKGGFEDFMLKEIHEQPKAVKDTLAGKIVLGKEITIDNIKLDKLTTEYLVEVKKSDADVKAATWQLMYYLKVLKSKGIERKGKLEFIEKNKSDKKIIIIELDEENEIKLDKYVKEIEELIINDKIPETLNKGKCKKCAYYEYCYI